jgi:hypothetical protein
MRIALVVYPYYKECKEPLRKRKAFGIYARKKWLRMHKFSYRKSEIVKCEKKIRREPGSEKPGIINKIKKILEILIEKVTEILVNALNGKARKIYTALNLFLCFGIFFLSY